KTSLLDPCGQQTVKRHNSSSLPLQRTQTASTRPSRCLWPSRRTPRRKCPLVSQYESLYLPEFLLYFLRPLVLPFKLHFPLGAVYSLEWLATISCGVLLCCPIQLVLFGLIMLKMLLARVFKFFSSLPSSRNSRISWGTGIEFFYQTYRACCDRRCCKRRQN
uniref:Uncharacterized protein n=1 Tax=Anser brachyrhynchus TaxID=132585 RepID=A0A8B9CK92_9AVES